MQIYYGHSMDKSQGHFCHESQLGHVIGPSTAVAYVYWEDMREKKDVVYGLLFLLHDLADLRFYEP